MPKLSPLVARQFVKVIRASEAFATLSPFELTMFEVIETLTEEGFTLTVQQERNLMDLHMKMMSGGVKPPARGPQSPGQRPAHRRGPKFVARHERGGAGICWFGPPAKRSRLRSPPGPRRPRQATVGRPQPRRPHAAQLRLGTKP